MFPLLNLPALEEDIVRDSALMLSLPWDIYDFRVDVTFFTDEGPTTNFYDSTVLYLIALALVELCLVDTFLMDELRFPEPWRLVRIISCTESTILPCFCVCDELYWDYAMSLVFCFTTVD